MDNDDKKKILEVIAWTFLILITAVCSFFYVLNKKPKMHDTVTGLSNIVTERYYCTVDTQEEAIIAAIEAGGQLESYADGVAVITIKKTIQNILGSAKPSDEIEAGDTILKKEDVYKIDETKAPARNFYYDNEWFLDAIGFKNVYKNGITGAGTVVAVIDTGCQLDHPDLSKNIIGWYNAADPNDPTNVTDVCGHGTHVAGIIGAIDNSRDIVGVAPEASLYIIKVDHGTEGYMYASDVIRGINKAVEIGADVINMSLGGPTYNEDYEAALQNAVNNGAICIAAAGNESTDAPHYPSGYSCVMGVAASDEDGRLADFSNYGDINAQIVAPGDLIISTIPTNDSWYYSGTSMATPVVSGVAALIYGNDESLRNNNTSVSSETVRNIILNNRVMKTYTSKYGSVTGAVNAQAIFKSKKIATPATPVITEKKQEGTNQVIVKVTCETKGVDIYYTTDGKYPYISTAQKYDKKIRLDKKGEYTIRAVAVKKRAYSNSVKKEEKVTGTVYSQKLIKSMRIHLKNESTTQIGHGKEKQLYITFDEKPSKTVDLKSIKWETSDKKLATVSNSGKVKVTDNTDKIGKSVTISGKFGSVTKTFTFTIK